MSAWYVLPGDFGVDYWGGKLSVPTSYSIGWLGQALPNDLGHDWSRRLAAATMVLISHRYGVLRYSVCACLPGLSQPLISKNDGMLPFYVLSNHVIVVTTPNALVLDHVNWECLISTIFGCIYPAGVDKRIHRNEDRSSSNLFTMPSMSPQYLFAICIESYALYAHAAHQPLRILQFAIPSKDVSDIGSR